MNTLHMPRRRYARLMGAVLTPILALACAVVANAQGTAPADWQKVVEAARAEKSVTFYSSLVDVVNRAVSDGFQKKYGITVNVIRAASGPLTQRFAAEMDSKTYAADVIMPSSGGPFLATALSKGWLLPVNNAGLPALQSGAYAAKWLRPEQGSAIVIVLPWIIAYNEDLMKERKLTPPKEWKDVLDARYKGQILLPDPGATDSYIQFWDFMLKTYGEGFLRQLKQQDVRMTSSGAPNVQALAAGEGAITFPTIGSLVESVAKSGAPVKGILAPATTGNEIAITLSRNAPHPNAARLLVDYILSPEGNRLMAIPPFEFSVYAKDLPAQYKPPSANAVTESKTKILEILGSK